MGKSICYGNSNTLIGLDKFGQIHDLYYPYVGLENHLMGNYTHKIGVWADNKFSWFDDGSWQILIDFEKDTMIGKITATNSNLQLKIELTDCLYNQKDIFIRLIKIQNLAQSNRKIKLFINQQFEISESFRGDTAIYDHDQKCIVHYKGERFFMINARNQKGETFDDYSIGLLGIEGKEGTYKDSEDGILSKNNVEHGRVDSVIGLTLEVEASSAQKVEYWITIGKNISEVHQLNDLVLQKTPQKLVDSTRDYWEAWLSKQNIDFLDLDQKYIDQFKKSLLLIDTHAGENGVIIASGDSDLLKNGRGTYSYMWPRDGALVILPLIQAGYFHIPENFFRFCADVITDEGYMLHKYRADSSLGSSWHPWVRDLKNELPIQEDETALVLYAFWKYYEQTKDLELVQEMYQKLIKNPAEFMVKFIDPKTKLPSPTYDLWEEKFGISTFTASTVYAGLNAAANFAELLGKTEDKERYLKTAFELKEAILKYLWSEELGSFVKLVNFTDKGIFVDKTVDMSSIHGILEFGVLDIRDEKVIKSIATVEQKIVCKTDIGGVCRYEGDYYFRVSYDTPGNPWFITSLWLGKYYLKKAKSESELAQTYKWLDWTIKNALPSGVLSEQINPFTGEQLSATPLTWSQAEYVKIVLELIQKLKELRKIS
jgi:glucoamylase